MFFCMFVSLSVHINSFVKVFIHSFIHHFFRSPFLFFCLSVRFENLNFIEEKIIKTVDITNWLIRNN
jgi:hypothetical protein